ncbi:MAG: choice-of-anchor Q domain-containing protein [Stenotrophobium sp.]
MSTRIAAVNPPADQALLIRRIVARHAPVSAIASLCTLGLLLGPNVAAASTPLNLTVNSTGDFLGIAGVCTLRSAILAVNAGVASAQCPTSGSVASNTITIPSSVTGTITLNSALPTITAAVTLNGPGASSLSISGNNRSQIFYIGQNADTTISGLTLTNGGGSNGGAIYSYSNLSLNNCIVTGSAAHNGGGVFVQGISGSAVNTLTLTNSTVSNNTASNDAGGLDVFGSLILTNSRVSGNTATSGRGGGIRVLLGNATLTDSTLSGNTTAALGGGLYVEFGNLTMTDSTVSGNTAHTYGGGLALVSRGSSTFTVSNSTVSGNTARFNRGGGLFVANGTLAMSGSTVSGNTGVYGGGGLYLKQANATLTNSTVSGNYGVQYGGGLAFNAGSGHTTVTLTNSTVANNTASVGGDGVAGNQGTGSAVLNATNSIITGAAHNACNTSPITSGSNNLITDTTCGTKTLVNNSATTLGALNLGPLGNNGGPTQTIALLPGSVAIDAGTSNGAPATDQRGALRPQGAGFDIGAYELGMLPPASFIDASGNRVTITTDVGAITNAKLVPQPANAPANTFSYDNGFFSFKVVGVGPGGTAHVTVTLAPGFAPAAYLKCNPVSACINTGAIYSINQNVITLTLTDGGLGDDDGVADGTITDPGAPAYSPHDHGGGGTGGSSSASAPSGGGALDLLGLSGLLGLFGLGKKLRRGRKS